LITLRIDWFDLLAVRVCFGVFYQFWKILKPLSQIASAISFQIGVLILFGGVLNIYIFIYLSGGVGSSLQHAGSFIEAYKLSVEATGSGSAVTGYGLNFSAACRILCSRVRD